ncbi:hypothetical protein [Candidatus Harpocratesius sp.]
MEKQNELVEDATIGFETEKETEKKKHAIRIFLKYLELHLIFLFYSVISLLAKFSAQFNFLSLEFVLLYGLIVFLLAVYAFFWQIILKKHSLMTAFSHKGMVLFWTMLWAYIVFKESISWLNLLGCLIIFIGIQFIARGEIK